MFLFAAITFVLLTHLQLIGLLMIGGSLVAAVAMYVTRPRPELSPSTSDVVRVEQQHEDADEYEYPHAA